MRTIVSANNPVLVFTIDKKENILDNLSTFYLSLDVFKKALPLGRFIAILFTFGLSSLLHVSINFQDN